MDKDKRGEEETRAICGIFAATFLGGISSSSTRFALSVLKRTVQRALSRISISLGMSLFPATELSKRARRHRIPNL